MKERRIIGGVLILLGLILTVNSLSGITGFVIVDTIEESFSFFTGVVSILIGGILIVISRKYHKIQEIEKEGETAQIIHPKE